MFAPGRAIYVLIFLLAPLFVAGQAADTSKHTLRDATVTDRQKKTGNDKINDHAPGQKITTIDTTTLKQYAMQSVATLLTQQLPVFVRSYGVNGLATLNFRGASAAQSQVYWNGVPVQNPALGVADVSIMPVLLMDNVSLVYGGSAGLLGSGNVGGALMLDNNMQDPGKTYKLSLSGGAGSFGQYTGGITAGIYKREWSIGIKGIVQGAQNDFTYTDNNVNRNTMTHAALHGNAWMLDAAHGTGMDGMLHVRVWAQQYMRQIPAALFEAGSLKEQNDQALRTQLQWTNGNKHTCRVDAIASYSLDEVQYNDAAILLHSTSTVYQYFQEIRVSRSLGGSKLSLFSPVQVSWMNSGAMRKQYKTAIAAAWSARWLQGRLNMAASARLESIDSAGLLHAPQPYLLPGINGAYKLRPWLSLRANVQRTYRVPSLNELYYYPGGNPALKPEQGWASDAGYAVSFRWKRLAVQHDVSVFDRNIKDWIIWLGGAVWTPHNIAAVHSRGVETENRVTCKLGKWKLHAGLNTAYVLATTTRSYIYNDGSIGRQIPYSPRYNGQLNVGCTYGRLYINYNHTYTGYRFTVADESAYLPPYQTGNIQAMYSVAIGSYPIQLMLQVNNIWNEHYNVVFDRPMPPANVLAGIRADIL